MDKDREKLNLYLEDFPSPEELFQIEEDKTEKEAEDEQPLKKKSIPKYRVVKFFSAGFVILLLVLALLLTNLDRFRIHCYCMLSESMGEVIPKESVIFAYETPVEELKKGDVITYNNSEGISVTHEIEKVMENYQGSGYPAFQTKGAENTQPDEEIVTYSMVKGKVIIYIPYVGKIFEGILESGG